MKQQESRQKARITSIEKHAFDFNGGELVGSSQLVVNSQCNQSIDRINQSRGLLRQNQVELLYGGHPGFGDKILEVQQPIRPYKALLTPQSI